MRSGELERALAAGRYNRTRAPLRAAPPAAPPCACMHRCSRGVQLSRAALRCGSGAAQCARGLAAALQRFAPAHAAPPLRSRRAARFAAAAMSADAAPEAGAYRAARRLCTSAHALPLLRCDTRGSFCALLRTLFSPLTRPRPRAAAVGSAADAAPPAWVAALAARPGVTAPPAHRYWESPVQPHGECTVIALLHEGAEPAVAGARVFLEESTRTVYGVWPLGRRVCGHPGIVHGGVSALLLDEMFGQAYWAWFAPVRGPGYTANLNIDYKAPAPAGRWLCATVRVLSEEGRKVRLEATLADAPEGEGGAVFATATCLFVVARKE